MSSKSDSPDGKGPSYTPAEAPEDAQAEAVDVEETRAEHEEAREAARTSDPESGYDPANYDTAAQSMPVAGPSVQTDAKSQRHPELGAISTQRTFRPEENNWRGYKIPDEVLEGMSSADLRAVAHDRGYDLGNDGGKTVSLRRFQAAQSEDKSTKVWKEE